MAAVAGAPTFAAGGLSALAGVKAGAGAGMAEGVQRRAREEGGGGAWEGERSLRFALIRWPPTEYRPSLPWLERSSQNPIAFLVWQTCDFQMRRPSPQLLGAGLGQLRQHKLDIARYAFSSGPTAHGSVADVKASGEFGLPLSAVERRANLSDGDSGAI